jgi:hypothetical protein
MIHDLEQDNKSKTESYGSFQNPFYLIRRAFGPEKSKCPLKTKNYPIRKFS